MEEERNRNEEKDEFFDAPPAPEPTPAPAPAPEPAQDGQEQKVRSRRKTLNAIASVILALILVAAGFLGGWFVRQAAIPDEVQSFLWALDTTEKYYYQPIDRDAVLASVTEDSDAESWIDALNAEVDIYSGFYTLSEYDALLLESAGQNVGVGISVWDAETEQGVLPQIAIVVQNSPAELAGIEKGMYVYSFGTDPASLDTGNTDELIAALSAVGAGDTCYLNVGYTAARGETVPLVPQAYQAVYCSYRDSETSYSFRGELGNECVETGNPIVGLPGDTAYIRIDEFSGNAANEFAYLMNIMRERGRIHLILDLRTNGGGSLDILQSIASFFCRSSSEAYPPVVTARYKDGTTEINRAANNLYSEYFYNESKIYLLADENTASASEALIGVLIDYGALEYSDIWLREENGVAKTYGKGIMQTFYVSPYGVMKLTVATIHWPTSDTCIHDVGITTASGTEGHPHGVSAPMVWGEDDIMLNALVAAL